MAGGALAWRTIFAYAGNMGGAQGMGIVLDLADRLRVRRDVGVFLSAAAVMPNYCARMPSGADWTSCVS